MIKLSREEIFQRKKRIFDALDRSGLIIAVCNLIPDSGIKTEKLEIEKIRSILIERARKEEI